MKTDNYIINCERKLIRKIYANAHGRYFLKNEVHSGHKFEKSIIIILHVRKQTGLKSNTCCFQSRLSSSFSSVYDPTWYTIIK
jgi:hypothetical protein